MQARDLPEILGIEGLFRNALMSRDVPEHVTFRLTEWRRSVFFQ
jgi:hypothetical protein